MAGVAFFGVRKLPMLGIELVVLPGGLSFTGELDVCRLRDGGSASFIFGGTPTRTSGSGEFFALGFAGLRNGPTPSLGFTTARAIFSGRATFIWETGCEGASFSGGGSSSV